MPGSMENQNNLNSTAQIVKTDLGAKDGQNKCPKCGATDISLNINNGKLRCNFCRHEFEPEKITGMEQDITKLSGQILASGAQDIAADTKDVLTFKCSSCGAEVVIDTTCQNQARCHWCRNTLSVNQQIPNGAIPDVVLPFQISKDEAKRQIEKFVGKRKFFAHPKFKQEFNSQNIMGVYFPYMVVDINSHANFIGQGERQKNKYTKGTGSNIRTYYDAEVYNIEREFDLAVHGLTIESNSDRLNQKDSNKTNNVINAIMPFDIEHCAKYNANYLKGYTSERRNTNTSDLQSIVQNEAQDIARFAANETLKEYDRGVAWSNESLDIKGLQWTSAYLPVWLYSYQQVNGNNKVLHYVAVNARTKKTMGSVPIHMPALIGVSLLVEIICIVLMFFIDFEYNALFLLGGFIYFFLMFTKYRNANARHKHEIDTQKEMNNLRKVDNYLTRRNAITNPTMEGANNHRVSSDSFSSQLLNSIANQNTVTKLIKDTITKNGGDK